MKKIKEYLSEFKIRDAKTDEYVVGLMDRDFLLSGRCIAAIFVFGFIVGILLIVFAMCSFG